MSLRSLNFLVEESTRCSLEIREREKEGYHPAVAGGPTRWHPSLALNAEEFTTMLGLSAIPSAHRLSRLVGIPPS